MTATSRGPGSGPFTDFFRIGARHEPAAEYPSGAVLDQAFGVQPLNPEHRSCSRLLLRSFCTYQCGDKRLHGEENARALLCKFIIEAEKLALKQVQFAFPVL